jgi:toxin ParE1/3/4
MSSSLTLIWTSTALADLQRLRSFIAQHNPHAAKRAAQTIKQAVMRLLDHPELGKPLDGREDRELFIPFGQRGYVLRYRLHGNAIIVLKLWHGLEDR